MDFVIGVALGAAAIALVVMISLAKSAKEIDEAETDMLSSAQDSTQSRSNNKEV